MLPYQLDLTQDVQKRLIREFNDVHFEKKAGNYLAIERNESFTKVDEKRDRDMFGVVWCKDQEGDFGIVITTNYKKRH